MCKVMTTATLRRVAMARATLRNASREACADSPSPAAPKLSRNELNFSAGPGALPTPVLAQAQAAIDTLPETGLSVLGMSHRSPWFAQVLRDAEQDIRILLDAPSSRRILFLQGGSSLQFSMIPMNFSLAPTAPADYVVSGYWSQKSLCEARPVVDARIAWDGASTGYRTLPGWSELKLAAGGSYLHYISNETVEGLQFGEPPDLDGRPAICDMSSDFLSRRIDVSRFGMIYAHAQKNLGPAGVTVAVIDETLLDRVPAGLPPMLDFRTHVKHGSNYNTPPVFAIYVTGLVARWLRTEFGSLEKLEARNRRKAATIYNALAGLETMIELHADPGVRSTMNVAFRFRETRLQSMFLDEAAARGISGLEGHRSIGGLRISLYNAVSETAVSELAGFIKAFAATRG
jgi:phosphoserine aminotransferase